MEWIALLWDLAVHLDQHLGAFLARYGTWIYALLFVVVFCETGLVVTPFLPGDSLLFVAGTLWAAAGMDINLLMALLIVAAVAGDAVNYAFGRYVGPRVFHEGARWLNRRALDRTHAFYERHGGKTIIIARFVPIVRTYAPFVAGVGAMTYRKFALYNVAGAVLWVVSLSLAGYFFGNIPVVKRNLTVVILIIVALSLAPIGIEWLRYRRAKASSPSEI